MSLYSNKRRSKLVLLTLAIILVGLSLWASNRIVEKVAQRERERVTQWGDAIKKRAELVLLTNNSFNELRSKELAEMELWIDATKEISQNTSLDSYRSYDLPLKIINRNKDIPVIVLTQDSTVSTYINLNFDVAHFKLLHPEIDSIKAEQLFKDSLVKLAHSWGNAYTSFTIEVYTNMYMSFFYTDSRQISRLEEERDSLIHAFNAELIDNPELVPVVLTNSNKNKVVASNLLKQEVDSITLATTLTTLSKENQPIEIQIGEHEVNFLYYANSPELVQLQYFPYIQFALIGLFILIGYIIFSTFRKAEQNKVWAGMAKETAHQLGTPISSLMAWVQLLESKPETQEIAKEMDKDIHRLSHVTNRFSKIGAETELEDADIIHTIQEFLEYFGTRVPKKVTVNFHSDEKELVIPHNPPLFEWVIENICKNAVDAMEGEGKISIKMIRNINQIYIDISDTGKGMTSAQARSVFEPGFTTKKRGWGLGLSLAKRIIEENHKGRLKVLHSEVGKGTTFRITLTL
ncbi:MAG: HAMP domain-containing histidine kinase [Brumimicrobium sp.]|nr:HAMP domain-containing histidine kinase [Brumimicrobium sp.]